MTHAHKKLFILHNMIMMEDIINMKQEGKNNIISNYKTNFMKKTHMAFIFRKELIWQQEIDGIICLKDFAKREQFHPQLFQCASNLQNCLDLLQQKMIIVNHLLYTVEHLLYLTSQCLRIKDHHYWDLFLISMMIFCIVEVVKENEEERELVVEAVKGVEEVKVVKLAEVQGEANTAEKALTVGQVEKVNKNRNNKLTIILSNHHQHIL